MIAARVATWLAAWLVLSATVAAPALAGWSPTARVQSGIDPVLAFGPSGAAAIGSRQHDPTQAGGMTFLSIRRAHGRFSTPQRLRPASDRAGDLGSLESIALTSNGAVALLFYSDLNSGYALPATALVRPAGASGFGAAQRLTDVGGADQNTPYGLLATTARGQVLAAASDSLGNVTTYRLSGTGSRLGARRGIAALSGTGVGPLSLITDSAGGAFLTDLTSCPAVAYRPQLGNFAKRYQDRCRNNESVDGLDGWGAGHAALLTETTGSSRTTFSVQLGRYGHFGSRVRLDTVPFLNNQGNFGSFVSGGIPVDGIAADQNGAVTVDWAHCAAGTLKTDGAIPPCAIYGVVAESRGRFGPRELIVAAPK